MKFNGLSDKQVEEARKKYGSNEIPDSEPTTFLKEFLATFGDPMIKILLVIAGLMLVIYLEGENNVNREIIDKVCTKTLNAKIFDVLFWVL